MTSETDDTAATNSSLEETRLAAVEEVEEILVEVEEVEGRELSFIHQSINIAKNDPLDDGEFNYSVRLALIQLFNVVEQNKDHQDDVMERIQEFRENLADKANLPPEDEIAR